MSALGWQLRTKMVAVRLPCHALEKRGCCVSTRGTQGEAYDEVSVYSCGGATAFLPKVTDWAPLAYKGCRSCSTASATDPRKASPGPSLALLDRVGSLPCFVRPEPSLERGRLGVRRVRDARLASSGLLALARSSMARLRHSPQRRSPELCNLLIGEDAIARDLPPSALTIVFNSLRKTLGSARVPRNSSRNGALNLILLH